MVKRINSEFPRQALFVAPILSPVESKRVMDQLCERIRYLHYSLRTKQASHVG
jgi:hypothetical protein